MEDIQRYDIVKCSDSSEFELMDKKGGRFVEYDDHKQQLARLKTEVERLKSALESEEGVDITVTELPEIKQPQTFETGILMSPAEITECDSVVEIGYGDPIHHRHLSVPSDLIGKRLHISEQSFPREFYKDIQTSIDWESIPVGSLVEVEFEVGDKSCGWYFPHHDTRYVSLHYNTMQGSGSCNGKGYLKANIQSIRIIELPEVKE